MKLFPVVVIRTKADEARLTYGSPDAIIVAYDRDERLWMVSGWGNWFESVFAFKTKTHATTAAKVLSAMFTAKRNSKEMRGFGRRYRLAQKTLRANKSTASTIVF